MYCRWSIGPFCFWNEMQNAVVLLRAGCRLERKRDNSRSEKLWLLKRLLDSRPQIYTQLWWLHRPRSTPKFTFSAAWSWTSILSIDAGRTIPAYVQHLENHGSMLSFYMQRLILCSCAFLERNTMAFLVSAKVDARFVFMYSRFFRGGKQCKGKNAWGRAYHHRFCRRKCRCPLLKVDNSPKTWICSQRAETTTRWKFRKSNGSLFSHSIKASLVQFLYEIYSDCAYLVHLHFARRQTAWKKLSVRAFACLPLGAGDRPHSSGHLDACNNVIASRITLRSDRTYTNPCNLAQNRAGV